MALTLNAPCLGLRASLSGDAIVFVPREGICDGIVLNTPYIGLRAGVSGDAVVFVISDQQLTMGDKLVIDKPYIGLRAAQGDGSLVYLVQGIQCEPDPYCCEYVLDDVPLTATLSIAGMPSSPFTITLTKQSQPVGTESCYQIFEGSVNAATPGGNYAVSARLACQLAPKCDEWRFTINAFEFVFGTPNLTYSVTGTLSINLASDSPILFDTKMSTVGASEDCCADVPGWPGPAENSCSSSSSGSVNLTGSAITMDISE